MKVKEEKTKEAIGALMKLHKKAPKKGVDLVSITKRLSAKKFGKGGMDSGC